MLKRNIGIYVLLATLVSSVFVLVFSTPNISDAGPIAIYNVTEIYKCIRGSDNKVCVKKEREYEDKDEPFLHQVNPFVHPHSEPEPIDLKPTYSGEVVTYCSECNPPTW